MILNPQDVEVEKSAKTQDQGAICLSECASDFIAPLPKTVLPTNKRKKLKIDSFSDGLRDAGKRYFLVMLRDHLKRSLSTAESVCIRVRTKRILLCIKRRIFIKHCLSGKEGHLL